MQILEKSEIIHFAWTIIEVTVSYKPCSPVHMSDCWWNIKTNGISTPHTILVIKEKSKSFVSGTLFRFSPNIAKCSSHTILCDLHTVPHSLLDHPRFPSLIPIISSPLTHFFPQKIRKCIPKMDLLSCFSSFIFIIVFQCLIIGWTVASPQCTHALTFRSFSVLFGVYIYRFSNVYLKLICYPASPLSSSSFFNV